MRQRLRLVTTTLTAVCPSGGPCLLCLPLKEKPPSLKEDTYELEDSAHDRRRHRYAAFPGHVTAIISDRAPSAIDHPPAVAQTLPLPFDNIPPPPPEENLPPLEEYLHQVSGSQPLASASNDWRSNFPRPKSSQMPPSGGADDWRSNFPPSKDHPAPGSANERSSGMPLASESDWRSNFPPSKDRPPTDPVGNRSSGTPQASATDWRSNFPPPKDRPPAFIPKPTGVYSTIASHQANILHQS